MNNQNLSRTGNKGKGRELVIYVRKALFKAFEMVDSTSKPVAQHLQEAFEQAPLKFLDTVAKHLPKEITAEITRTYEANKLTDDELADVIAKRARKRHDDALKPDQDKFAATG